MMSRFLIADSVAVLCGATLLRAQSTAPVTHEFTGQADRSWTNASNWQSGVVPGVGDATDVVVGFKRGKPVDLTSDARLRRAVLYSTGASELVVRPGATLTIGDGAGRPSLTLLGAFGATGRFTSAGKVEVQGDAVLADDKNQKGNLHLGVANGGTLYIAGNLSLRSNTDGGIRTIGFYNNGVLDIAGDFDADGAKASARLVFNDHNKGIGQLRVGGALRFTGELAINVDQLNRPGQHPLIEMSGDAPLDLAAISGIILNGSPYRIGESVRTASGLVLRLDVTPRSLTLLITEN